jgi:tRNA dimethylallyltransferase
MALDLAERHRLEAISADSRQIYRGMDVGTAKPSAAELESLPHHLVDIADPDEVYSAGLFADQALRAVREIRSRGAEPLVVGGTGLYMIALAGGLDDLPARCDRIRGAIRAAEGASPGFMRRALTRLDAERAGEIGASDLVRHVRSLEIIIQSGRRVSELRKGGDTSEVLLRTAGLALPLEQLRARIADRAEAMVGNGLVDEVRRLLQAGYGRESALGRTIGYTEVLDCLEGLAEFDGLAERIARNTWSLARRQRNIFRRIPGVRWFGPKQTDAVEEYLFGSGEGA